MRSYSWLIFPVLLLLNGCVYSHTNDSATASTEEIKEHLIMQLHFQALELWQIHKDSFSGTGTNDTGPFQIEVTREGGQIHFHGVYTEPVKGTFSGSAGWSRNASAFFGLHKSESSEQSSLRTP